MILEFIKELFIQAQIKELLLIGLVFGSAIVFLTK